MVDFQKAHDCLLIDSKFCPAEVGWACLGSHPHKTEINKRVGERTVRRSFLKRFFQLNLLAEPRPLMTRLRVPIPRLLPFSTLKFSVPLFKGPHLQTYKGSLYPSYASDFPDFPVCNPSNFTPLEFRSAMHPQKAYMLKACSVGWLGSSGMFRRWELVEESWAIRIMP